MRRDLDLIREILLATEAQDPGKSLSGQTFNRDREDELTTAAGGYHVDLLLDAGFVVGKVYHSEGEMYLGWTVDRLTHDGADYLDSVRDAEIYRQTKKSLLKVGGSASLEVVKEVAQVATRLALGLG